MAKAMTLMVRDDPDFAACTNSGKCRRCGREVATYDGYEHLDSETFNGLTPFYDIAGNQANVGPHACYVWRTDVGWSMGCVQDWPPIWVRHDARIAWWRRGNEGEPPRLYVDAYAAQWLSDHPNA